MLEIMNRRPYNSDDADGEKLYEDEEKEEGDEEDEEEAKEGLEEKEDEEN